MKKVFCLVILTCSFVCLPNTGQAIPVEKIIENLKSEDVQLVEDTCKMLQVPRGALGLSNTQLLHLALPKFEMPFYILAISWEGPLDGYLILINSDGRPIKQQRVGYIKKILFISLSDKGNKDVCVVDAITGTGTGVRLDELHIITVDNLNFRNLWIGVSYERSFPLLVAPNDNYEIEGTLNFDDINHDGVKELIYNTKQIHYSYDPESEQLAPVKTEDKTEIYKLVGEKFLLYNLEVEK